jgi:predicted nucleic acid-binding protein
VIVDTSVWVDYFAGRPGWQVERVDQELSAERPVGMTDIVYAEVLQGIKNDRDLLITERRLLALDVIELGGLEDFRAAAEFYRAVRRSGHTIRRTSDCLIAVVCIRAERPLLHRDADFDRLADVSELVTVKE